MAFQSVLWPSKNLFSCEHLERTALKKFNVMEKIVELIKNFDIGNSTPVDCLIFINDLKEYVRKNILL